MKKLLIITGPTATGKSNFAIMCAKMLNGEIVSADSMQIYKGLDIGTAKITEEEMQGVPHHMINIVEPYENFSVAEYQKNAIAIVENIFSRGKVPIIVGGTGLYINSILYPMQFASRENTIRRELECELEQFGKEYIYEKLKKYDEQSYNRLHINDTKRVLRALEIALSGGKHSTEDTKSPRYNSLIIVLNADRDILYSRINKRVDQMLLSGLTKEVEKYFGNVSEQSCQAIGYKEIVKYINGELAYSEAVELLKKNTRNYAKRQLTWFKQYKNAVWFDYNNIEAAIKLVKETFLNDNE